jgi:DnaK suppressor protein
LIEAERDRVEARIAALRSTFDNIVASTADDPPDDEHDPEGATIAFERQQLATFIRDAQETLVGLDAALARLRDGTYGICERCGNVIPSARLEARPTARRCVACA